MRVGADRALADRKRSGPAQRHVLTDSGDRGRDRLVDGLRSDLHLLELLQAGAVVQRRLGDELYETLEMIVARDEVGLRVDLDEDAFATLDRDPDQALGRDAAGLLRGFGEALLAQPVDRGLHVAVGRGKRGL